MIIIDLNWPMLERANYENFDAVKELVVLYSWLGRRTAAGNTIESAIWVDLKSAIYDEPVMRGKQLEVIELISCHYLTQEQVGLEMQISQQAVSRIFNRAINTIMTKLNSGELYKTGGNYIKMLAGGSDADSAEIEHTNKINCVMCRKEFKRSELVNVISLYDGSDVYRCHDCYKKWVEPKANRWKNISKPYENEDFCPKCHVRLTTTKQCAINCH